MQLYKLTAIVGTLWLLASTALGDTLTFVAQPVSGGGIDDTWFNAANWFTSAGGNLVPAGRVPLVNETAIITGTVDLQASGVRVQMLVVTNNATITNGTVAVENLQMLSSSSINNTTVNVLTAATFGGTNCTLSAAGLNILAIASAALQPIAPATASSLVLTQGAAITNAGVLNLTDGSQLTGGGSPQCNLVIQPGAILSSTNSATIRGSSVGYLIIDNSGVVRVDGGALTFTGGIDWQCSAGTGEFRAAVPSSQLLFSSQFQIASGVVSSFTGSGTNHWLSGATVSGLAQVSVLDPNTQLAGPGNLEILDSVTGSGTLLIQGTTNQGGLCSWGNGTFGLAGLQVEPGANLLIGGGIGTSRQFAGFVITNSGLCTLWSGDLGFGQTAIFDNEPGGTFVDQADGAFVGMSGSGTFNNAGTFQKLSAGISQFQGTNNMPGPGFNNTGLVDLRSGQLNLLAGSSSGEFRVATGSILWFWGGTHTLNTGASFTGAGAVRLLEGAAAATWLVNDSINVPELELGANGTFDASGAPPAKPIQIGSLVTHDNAVITNATLQVQSFQMRDQSLAAHSSVTIGTNLTVAGTNCTLSGTSLILPSGVFGIMQPVAPAGGAVLNLSQGTAFQIGGQLALSGGSIIAGGALPQSKLVIQPGGLLSSTNSNVIQGSTNAQLIVDNSGTIRVDAGTLALADGLEWQSSSGIGEFQAAVSTALMLFTGPFQINSGVNSLFSGTGTNRLLGGGLIAGIAQVGGISLGSQSPIPGNLEITGSLSGAGSVHVLGAPAQTGALAWSNGTLGLAHVDIDAGAALMIGGGIGTIRQLSGCTLNNSGTCVLGGGDLSLGQGAVINNLAGGTFLLQTSVALALAPAAGSVTFNNSGTFLNSSGSGVSSVGAGFINSGKLEIQNGTMAFGGSWNQIQGTTLVDSGATLSGTNLTLLGGIVSGTGLIGGNLINSGGTISPGTAFGILSMGPGESYQQGASAAMAVEIGGAIAGSQYDQFAVGGSAFLDGQLLVSLVNGFVPAPGQSFQVLTSRSLNGKFASVTAPPGGMMWVQRYTATNLTLVLAGNMDLARPTISGGVLSFPVTTSPGVVYVVEATTELSPPNWQTIRTIAGDGTVKTISDSVGESQRFYRVLLE
jgi:fibronectin-binding autotransporter adhesin